MKIVPLNEESETIFWNHINQDPLNYYFFIFDWKLRRDQTKIFMAMKDDRIDGLLLIYRDFVVQLRGSREAVKLLLNQVTQEKVDLSAPLDCEDIILCRYKPKVKETITLMSLRKSQERIQIRIAPERLSENDAEEISELMRKEDPVWWGEMTSERIKLMFRDALWLGIRHDNMIASLGMARPVDFGSNIGIVVTQEQFRNRGYATSIVSALAEEILKASSTALIHVLSDNASAIRVYSKVGFKPFRSYLSIHT